MTGISNNYVDRLGHLSKLEEHVGADQIQENVGVSKEAIAVEGWLSDHFATGERGAGSSRESIARIVCAYANLLPALEHVFSPYYNINLSSRLRSIDEADVFFLGETHDVTIDSSRVLNGKFISYLAAFYNLVIFIESSPSMCRVDRELAKRHFFIDSKNPNLYFLGWDVNAEIMSILQRLRKENSDCSKEYNAKHLEEHMECVKKLEILSSTSTPELCSMYPATFFRYLRTITRLPKSRHLRKNDRTPSFTTPKKTKVK